MDVESSARDARAGAVSQSLDGIASGATAFLPVGNPRPVLDAVAAAVAHGRSGAIAVVLDTEGSTYAGVGDMVLFADDAQTGWLSGGCLEPALAKRALAVDAAGEVEWIEIDTRSDDDLLAGSALGCRGRLRIALLPLRRMAGMDLLADAWRREGLTLHARIGSDGAVAFRAGDHLERWQLGGRDPGWSRADAAWCLAVPRLPRVLVLGAGPETPTLAPMLRDMGWWISLAERRARWREVAAAADAWLQLSPAEALASGTVDAALVMHHDFELDREALLALAGSQVAFIGLLGPPRRREDLFKLLTLGQQRALAPRLRSPVGLDLGGRGPEAIALSIAAQLQQWRGSAAAARA